jgi:hypothetical protein
MPPRFENLTEPASEFRHATAARNQQLCIPVAGRRRIQIIQRVLMACATLLLGLWPGVALAQPVVPPEAIDQFNRVVGTRVEALTILGGDYGASGGLYKFRGGNVADLEISKLGGGGMVAAPRPLGEGEVTWAPVVQGNIGRLGVANEFRSGYLQGNRMKYEVLAVQLGGGARFYFNEHFSLAPTFSAIYGHTENQFLPQNAVGTAVQTVASGTYVDWTLDTWSVVPSLDAKYQWNWGRTTFEFSSRYNFFHTESFASSSPVINIQGDSHTWENKLDVDVPLGWKLFGQELHTGGYLGRTELFGGVADGMNENHVNIVNGRLVLDLAGKLWKVQWLGLGYSYFFGEHFEGWSAGATVRFQF